jgi:DNA modification methylase
MSNITVDLKSGDVRQVLKSIPDNSVHCVITSPPYFGHRTYGIVPQIWGDICPYCNHKWRVSIKPGVSGGIASKKVHIKGTENFQIVPDSEYGVCNLCGAVKCELGQEPTPELFVQHLVEVFREVKRVLRPDGTLWLNLGDSYSSGKCGRADSGSGGKFGGPRIEPKPRKAPEGMRSKNLMGIPWRVALTMQEDGWNLRSDIIWAKGMSWDTEAQQYGEFIGNPMPESMKTRPAKAHEHIFLLTKSDKYYFDMEAIKEPQQNTSIARQKRGISNHHKMIDGAPGQTPHSMSQPRQHDPDRQTLMMRNCRDVWSVRPGETDVWAICSKGFEGAHFAAMPQTLAKYMVLAGTSEKGCCPKCGTPWKRIIDRKRISTRPGLNSKIYEHTSDEVGNRDPQRHVTKTTTIGWEPGCDCGVETTIPCTILDPFVGSGTTCLVARELGRSSIGIDLNDEYLEMARQRLNKAKLGKISKKIF